MKRIRWIAFGVVVMMGLTALSMTRPPIGNLLVSGGPVEIGFDKLPDGTDTKEGLRIFNQYEILGVVFPNTPVIRDDAKLARSASRALVSRPLTEEFNQGPLVMRFTAPQRRVKVWVGQTQIQHFAQKAILRVFDADSGGSVLGADKKDLQTAPVGQPAKAEIALEVSLGSASIRRAEVLYVRASDEGDAATFEVIDDLEFEGEAAPKPSCPSTRNPTVTLTKPTSGLTVQNNEFILEGTISADAPLEEVTLTVSGSGSTSLPLLFGDLIGRSGTLSLGLTRIDGMLFPGSNTVTVKAKDCFGTGNNSRTVIFNPILDKTKFIFMGMEVTQAIQDMNNSVPLIAGKRTVVRVYLRVEGTTKIDSVSGALTACRPLAEGSPLCGDGLPIPGSLSRNLLSLNTITVNSSTDITAKRRGDATTGAPVNSLNFELPPDWITAGRLHLGISHLYIEGSESFLPCDGCDNPNPAFPAFPRYYEFQNTPPVRLRLVNVPYSRSGTKYQPRKTDFDRLESWLRRAYPTNAVLSTRITISGFSGIPDSDFDCIDVDSRLFWKRLYDRLFNDVDGRTRYYGLVFDGGGFMRGCAPDAPSTIASGPSGVSCCGSASWDFDGSFADWYGGHEIGHIYGREHPGFCGGQDRADSSYPYKDGLISGPDLRYFGFDLGDTSNGTDSAGSPVTPQRVYPPDVWTDVMTYCDSEWISDYTYTGILDHIRGLETISLLATDHLQANSSDTLFVLGRLNLTRSTILLNPFSRLQGLELSTRPASSPFNIELYDNTGRILARYPFTPKEDKDTPVGKDKNALIAEIVPYVSGASRIAITKDNKELISRIVTANAPQVKVLSPNGGETLQGPTATVTWNASDADGDQLAYSLLYSADTGKTWQTVAVDIQELKYMVNLDELPGSDRALFRVIATDGVNTSMDDSDAVFRVPTKVPEVRIISPGNQSSFSTIQTIVFVGEAFDREDGNLDGAALQWSSDKQGALGSGRSIAATSLTPGLHTMTLEAKDKSGAIGKASIQIEITPIAPVADAGPDQTVNAGSTVQLDGSKSRGVGQLIYQWEIVAKPEGSQATLSGAKAVKSSFIADLPGEYVVQLSIKDATSAGAVDRAVIKANPAQLRVSTNATARQVCNPTFSHELTVSWKVTGGRPPISVTIEITGPDGKKQTVDVKELEGTRTFSLAYPGGGSVSVKVTAKDASNSSSSAQSSVQLEKCQ